MRTVYYEDYGDDDVREVRTPYDNWPLAQKFDFERTNKINVSMFERLIRAPKGHAVPNGVLSIQRRMRRDICDLTREYYKDIVTVQDHVVTRKRVLSEPSYGSITRALPTSMTASESFWKGREIPGMQSHIYLMTHAGTQSKADVGLSKVNKHEASLCVWLAYYLVSCGVNRRSIAILTPYKGQLMLIRKMLLADRTSNRLLTHDNTERDQIRMSTVDRFQGDEADIVLVSLVVDETSRTPFVKLVNRMIVTLSRARLGMYVFGNVGYFDSQRGPNGSAEVKHWKRTFEILEQPAQASDNDAKTTVPDTRTSGEAAEGASDPAAGPGPPGIQPGEVAEGPGNGIPGPSSTSTALLPLTAANFTRARVGPKLPLCCPQHPLLSCIDVDEPQNLKLGFCNVPCEVPLPCTHKCGLSCHWPKRQHRQKCLVEVKPPCDQHPEPVTCDFAFANSSVGSRRADMPFFNSSGSRDLSSASKPVSIDEALAKYRCPEKVTVVLPCRHEETMQCAEEADIKERGKAYPKCNRQSPLPYVYPACSHEKQVTCHTWDMYTKRPESVPKCDEKVQYTPRSCGHERTVKCFEEQRYRAGTAIAPLCVEVVDYTPSTCDHVRKVKCHEEQAYRSGAVMPPLCLASVDYTPPTCDHKRSVRCHQEQDYRSGKSSFVCPERVSVSLPRCGHEQKVTCAQSIAIAQWTGARCAEQDLVFEVRTL